MTINIVVAASENNVIGKDDKLLWHLPTDLAFFKNVTWGMPVIMGRKTFEALGKPLNGRTNIVISRRPDIDYPGKAKGKSSLHSGVFVVPSLERSVEQAAQTDAKECFVIGGGEIYKLAMR